MYKRKRSVKTSVRLECAGKSLHSPMIALPSDPSNNTDGPPLEHFYKLRLPPKIAHSSSVVALSSVPGANSSSAVL